MDSINMSHFQIKLQMIWTQRVDHLQIQTQILHHHHLHLLQIKPQIKLKNVKE